MCSRHVCHRFTIFANMLPQTSLFATFSLDNCRVFARQHLVHKGGRRGFSMASPTEWNRLPQSARPPNTIIGFQSQLNTYLHIPHRSISPLVALNQNFDPACPSNFPFSALEDVASILCYVNDSILCRKQLCNWNNN